MSLIIKHYEFNPTLGKIAFKDYTWVVKESIDKITNTTAGIVIYELDNPAKDASVIGNTITLTHDTSSMSSSDALEILYTPMGSNATQEEVDSGTSRFKYITPKTLQNSQQFQDIKNTDKILEMFIPWNISNNMYKEIELDGDNVSQVHYWSDNSKILKLFTKSITYTDENPTQVILINEINGMTLTTNIDYSGIMPKITQTIT